MSAIAKPARPWAARQSAVRTWAALIAGLLVLGAVFHAEIGDAIEVWEGSTAYNHCFLILPIAAWLAWQRRATLAGLVARPTILPLPAVLVLGLVWFTADRLGIMEGRQLAVIGFLQLLFLAVLGWRSYRLLAAPLLYLFFLVPFGGFLVPLLQTFSTHFVVHGLDLLGIPNFNDGNTIEIPEGAFYIATACAGLRFLIAAFAFSVFYACVIYRSLSRRLLFIAVSLFVPVIANGLRCLGIVWLGHVLGSATAAATDHVLYGYLFFSIVLIMLIMLGLAFREDLSPLPAAAPPAIGGESPWPRCLVSAGAIVVAAALFPMLAARIDRAAAATPIAAPVAFAGCTPAPASERKALEGGGGAVSYFTCAQHRITIAVAVFPPRSDPKHILDTERAFSGQDIVEAETRTLAVPGATPPRWQMVIAGTPPAVTASALWIDGAPAPGGLRTRLRQALNSLFGGRYPPLVVTLSTDASPPEAADRLASFLASRRIDPAVRRYLDQASAAR